MTRKYAVLALDRFATDAKTAHGVIRYGTDEIVAVIDPSIAGKRVRDVLPYLQSDAPIVASVAEALPFAPTALLIGTAPKGGGLPPEWRGAVLEAIAARLEIVSGLHEILDRDREFHRAARAAGTTIWDVREPPDVPLFSGEVYGVASPILLTIGNDCAVGKMTVSLELVRAAERAGVAARFVPTGQTGVLIAGWGISVDRVIADFAAGAAEQLVLYAVHEGTDLAIVEGQGAINHPAYAAVTLALMTGSAPDALVLVCDPARTQIETYPTPTLRYGELIALHEQLLAAIKPASVIGIALNTHTLSDEEARAAIARARSETGLPAEDVVRYGADDFYAAIAPQIVKRPPLTAASGG
jgi:D-glutamate N-acetyltransferase